RFRDQGIKVYLEHRISEVKSDQIFAKTSQGEEIKIEAEMLIWTGGVKISSVVGRSLGREELRGAILVNQFLESEDHKNVYAAGDNAFCKDPGNPEKPLPMLASTAVQQGKLIA